MIDDYVLRKAAELAVMIYSECGHDKPFVQRYSALQLGLSADVRITIERVEKEVRISQKEEYAGAPVYIGT